MPFYVDLPDAPTADDIYDLDLTDKSCEQRSYNNLGRLETTIDYKGQATEFYYDGLGRLQFKEYYGAGAAEPNEMIEYAYDSLGRKTSQTLYNTEGGGSAAISWSDYEYDIEGNIVKVDTSEGAVNYSYHDVTQRKSSTCTDNSETQYSYDKLGRLKNAEVTKRDGQTLAEPEITKYNYNEAGSRAAVEVGNGALTEYTYDKLNRLTDLTHYETTSKINTLSSFGYTLNADGMRAEADEYLKYPSVGTDESPTVQYEYDNLNRLVSEGTTGSGYEIAYTYDLVGNRLNRSIDASDGSLDTAYIYDEADRLLKESHTDPFAAIPWNDNKRVYAYADGRGGFTYKLPGREKHLGQFGAFLYGLPNQWDNILLLAALILIPIVFLWPVLVQFWYQIRRRPPPEKPRLSVWRRGICVLLAYIFLLGPQCFQMLSDAAVQYGNISRLAWGYAGDVFSYFYDDNGSLIYKIYGDVDTNGNPQTIIDNDTTLEYDNYDYNIQNRLERVTNAGGGSTIAEITEYKYNPQGIRVQKHTWTQDDGTPQGDDITTVYLVDLYNHTGYAQVLEEHKYEVADPDPAVDSPVKITYYTIGDDVISQTAASDFGSGWELAPTEYILYDGHGSTRQLLNDNLTVSDAFSYDGYGVLLQDSSANPGYTPPQGTSLLYAGEMFDFDNQHYYNRARWYNPYNGRFNRTDPFAGNTQDPQSLHKYLYAHANPINNVDPTGQFSLTEMLTVATIVGAICGLYMGTYAVIRDRTIKSFMGAFSKWFWIGFVSAGIIYGVIWLTSAFLTAIFGASAGFGDLQHAKDYGISSYRVLRSQIAGTGLEAHHLYPSRFKELLGLEYDEMLCVALSKAEHIHFTNFWRKLIPYGVNTLNATKEQVFEAAKIIYTNYPAILKAAEIQKIVSEGRQ